MTSCNFASWILPAIRSTWRSVLAPAATPQPIIQKLSAALVAALKSREAREPMAKQGVIIVAGTPDQFPAYYASESAKWGESFEIWDGDHFSLVNWLNPFARNRGWGRDPTVRYGPLLQRLEAEGY